MQDLDHENHSTNPSVYSVYGVNISMYTILKTFNILISRYLSSRYFFIEMGGG